LSRLPAAIAFSFSPPAIPGVGTSGGFTFVLEDRAGNDVQFPRQKLGTFLEAARKRPEIAGLSTTFLSSVPQEFVDVDRDKVLKQGVPLNDVYRTIQAFMADISSTISTASAGNGRFISRPRAMIEQGRKTLGSSTFAIARERTSHCRSD